MHPTRLVAFIVLAACGAPSTHAPTTTRVAPPSAQPPPPPVAAPAITRIAAGGTPGSNTHRWGTRFFELRAQGGTTEIRLHDVVSFQGVGMRPEDMAPDRHACTPWEPLPPTIPAIPAGAQDCRAASAACDAIFAWYRSTAPPAPAASATQVTAHDTTYGRAIVACS